MSDNNNSDDAGNGAIEKAPENSAKYQKALAKEEQRKKLNEALRQNLLRRKAQARQRRGGDKS